jgi:hypothetical protein
MKILNVKKRKKKKKEEKERMLKCLNDTIDIIKIIYDETVFEEINNKITIL